MKGEKEFFRKRFFGGFNRDDVMKYIAKIAEERNEAVSAKEKAERGMRAITEELNRANSTREDAERDVRSLAEERNQAIDAKEKAEKDARAFAEELRKLREEMGEPKNEDTEEESAEADESTEADESADAEENIDAEKDAADDEYKQEDFSAGFNFPFVSSTPPEENNTQEEAAEPFTAPIAEETAPEETPPEATDKPKVARVKIKRRRQ